jgi:hypothetical protein
VCDGPSHPNDHARYHSPNPNAENDEASVGSAHQHGRNEPIRSHGLVTVELAYRLPLGLGLFSQYLDFTDRHFEYGRRE